MKIGDLVREVRELCRPQDFATDPYVGLEQIGQGTLHLASHITANGVISTTKRFAIGDILFGSLRPYFRKVVRAPFGGLCSTDITVLRASNEGDAAFAFYALASPSFIRHATSTSNGTRMPRAKWAVVSGFDVPDRSASARSSVGRTLAIFDELIENNTRRIKIAEEMARSLYREWFVEHRFPGHGNVKFLSTVVGRVPEGWSPATLADHIDDRREAVNPGDVEPATPYFGLEHLPRRSTTLSVWGAAGDVQSAKLRVRGGDLLFGKIRPYFHKVGISPVPAVSSTDAIVVRPRRAELRGLVLGCMSSDGFVARATTSSQGTKMPRANWEVLRREPLPLPPEPILSRFNSIVDPSTDIALTLGLKNRQLATSRDLLLPGLISGEIAVGSANVGSLNGGPGLSGESVAAILGA